MARKKFYIGSFGPFFYDDAKAIDDPDGDFAGEDNKALVTDGQMLVETAPTDANHVLRLTDVGTSVGDVYGPAASTDHAIARFDGVTGKLLQNSIPTIDDAGLGWFPTLNVGDVLGGNYTELQSDGEVNFHGTAGLPYGSCYMYHGAWAQVAAQNTWYNVSDSDFADGLLNSITHDGNGKLTVLKAGVYKFDVALDLEVTAANKHVEIGFEVNGSGSAEAEGIVCREVSSGNMETVVGTTALLDLAANDTVELCVRTTDAGNPTITVDCVSLNCVHIGGT